MTNPGTSGDHHEMTEEDTEVGLEAEGVAITEGTIEAEETSEDGDEAISVEGEVSVVAVEITEVAEEAVHTMTVEEGVGAEWMTEAKVVLAIVEAVTAILIATTHEILGLGETEAETMVAGVATAVLMVETDTTQGHPTLILVVAAVTATQGEGVAMAILVTAMETPEVAMGTHGPTTVTQEAVTMIRAATTVILGTARTTVIPVEAMEMHEPT